MTYPIADDRQHPAGDRIYIRLLTSDDLTERYLSWFRDPAVTEFLDARNLTRAEVESYISDGHGTGLHAMYGIFIVETDQHIGNVKIGPINWRHGTAGLVTVIGEPAFWGQGLARDAILAATGLAFETYGLRKLSDGVASGNEGSLKAYCAAGWIHEATMKGQHLIDGAARDRLVISCFNPAFFPAASSGET